MPQIEVHDAIGSWADAWDELVGATRHPTPFASSWWIDAAADRDRIVLLVIDGADLVGGLALTRRRRFGVDVYGHPGDGFAAPDHLDLLARPGSEAAVADAVGSWFGGSGPYLLRLEGVAHHSLLERALRGSTAIPFSTAPWLALAAGTAPEPVSSRVRSTIRRSRKRLAKQGFSHRRVDTDPVDLDRALTELLALHRLRWPDGSNFASGFDRLTEVLRHGARAGAVAVHELASDDQVIASMLVLDLPDRRCFYQSGRRMEHEWRGAGTVLMAEVVADAHARGFREFDFLRGREPYKSDWTDEERILDRLFASQGIRAGVVRWCSVGFERAKPGLRSIRDRVTASRSRLAGGNHGGSPA